MATIKQNIKCPYCDEPYKMDGFHTIKKDHPINVRDIIRIGKRRFLKIIK